MMFYSFYQRLFSSNSFSARQLICVNKSLLSEGFEIKCTTRYMPYYYVDKYDSAIRK